MKRFAFLMMMLIFTLQSVYSQITIINDSTAVVLVNGKEITLPGDFSNNDLGDVLTTVDSTASEIKQKTKGLPWPPKNVQDGLQYLLVLLPFLNTYWVRATRVVKTLKPYFASFGTNSIVFLSSLVGGVIWEMITSGFSDFSRLDWGTYSLFIWGVSVFIYEWITKSRLGKTPKSEEVLKELEVA